MMNSEIKVDNQLLALSGGVLLQLQRVEFIIYGLISHFNEIVLSKYLSFKELDSHKFLFEENAFNKYRKQTLGQIFNVLKKEFKLFNTEKLDNFLFNRNLFIHNFWRDFISSRRKSERDYEAAISFLNSLLNEAAEWEIIFKGMLYSMAESIIEVLLLDPFAKEKELQKYSHLKEFQNDFLISLDESCAFRCMQAKWDT